MVDTRHDVLELQFTRVFANHVTQWLDEPGSARSVSPWVVACRQRSDRAKKESAEGNMTATIQPYSSMLTWCCGEGVKEVGFHWDPGGFSVGAVGFHASVQISPSACLHNVKCPVSVVFIETFRKTIRPSVESYTFHVCERRKKRREGTSTWRVVLSLPISATCDITKGWEQKENLGKIKKKEKTNLDEEELWLPHQRSASVAAEQWGEVLELDWAVGAEEYSLVSVT